MTLRNALCSDKENHCIFMLTLMHAISPTYPILLDFFNLIIFDEGYMPLILVGCHSNGVYNLTIHSKALQITEYSLASLSQ